MNPFDLSGQSFLIFYIGVALIVIITLKLVIDEAEGGVPRALPLSDPYQIAWLRGGTPEAARIAVLSLTDRGLLAVSGVGLLLDLHNLYANAVNFGDDPHTFLRRLPLERVTAVHLSGGRWIDGPYGARRLLDDHLHDVPPEVFALLRELGRLAPQPLTVIIERDGRFPPIARLLEQLDIARAALAAGREAAA
jgi:Protein of unknown function (DUF692)